MASDETTNAQAAATAHTVTVYELLRDAEIVAPDDHSMTRFAPFVSIPPSARDALCSLVEAALIAKHEGRFEPLHKALGRVV